MRKLKTVSQKDLEKLVWTDFNKCCNTTFDRFQKKS